MASLVVIETQKIKSYLFASPFLRETRGASVLLDRLNRKKTRELLDPAAGDQEIFLGGGSGRILFADENAKDFRNKLIELYRQKTSNNNARVAVEIISPLPDIKESLVDMIRRGVRETQKHKLGRVEGVPLLGGRFLRPCISCGREPAEVMMREFGELRLCRSCRLKRQEVNKLYVKVRPGLMETRVLERARKLEKIYTSDFVFTTLAQYIEHKDRRLQLPQDFEEIGKASQPANYLGFIYAGGNRMGEVAKNLGKQFPDDEQAKQAYRACYHAFRTFRQNGLFTQIGYGQARLMQINLPLVQDPERLNDARLVQLWLERYTSPETKRAYLEDVGKLFNCLPGRSLREMTYTDLQGFLNSLKFYKPNSQNRIFTAVKSLFSFGHRLGQLPFNVAAALRAPKKEPTLITRILTEEMVLKILALEENPRNQVMLRLIYAAGLRVSEVCDLTWTDLISRPPAGQLTVRGKGDKTRPVLLSQATWEIVHKQLPSPLLPCLSRAKAVFSTARRSFALSARLHGGLASSSRFLHTGCAMPTPLMPWSVAPPCPWSRPPWAMTPWPQPASISMPGLLGSLPGGLIHCPCYRSMCGWATGGMGNKGRQLLRRGFNDLRRRGER